MSLPWQAATRSGVRAPQLRTILPADPGAQAAGLGPAGLRAAALASCLAGAVWIRTSLVGAGVDPILTGALFGLLLAGMAVAARGVRTRQREAAAGRANARRSAAWSVGLGLAGGAGLVGVALAGRIGLHGLSVGNAVPFAAWALVTVVVAAGEEAILRGALFDALVAVAGEPFGLLGSALAFALLHVPLYGPAVVPLDLAVGLCLGGLRLATHGVVAPAIAHAVADLATWWL